MIKAVALLLGLTFVLATPPVSWSQPAPAGEAAVNEAIYRQMNVVLLRQKLQDAREAQNRHQLDAAFKLYN